MNKIVKYARTYLYPYLYPYAHLDSSIEALIPSDTPHIILIKFIKPQTLVDIAFNKNTGDIVYFCDSCDTSSMAIINEQGKINLICKFLNIIAREEASRNSFFGLFSNLIIINKFKDLIQSKDNMPLMLKLLPKDDLSKLMKKSIPLKPTSADDSRPARSIEEPKKQSTIPRAYSRSHNGYHF